MNKQTVSKFLVLAAVFACTTCVTSSFLFDKADTQKSTATSVSTESAEKSMAKYRLVLVSQNGCPPCDAVKKFLNNASIPFEVIEFQSLHRGRFKNLLITSRPTLVVLDQKGEYVDSFAGYYPSLQKQWLGKYKLTQ